MIKRFLLLSLAGLFLTGTAYAADMKVGIVNIQTIIQKAPQRETMMLAAQDSFKERNNQLKALDEEIKSLREKGQKDRMTMSNEDLIKLSREIELKTATLQLQDKAFKEDFKARVDQENAKLVQLANKAINQIALSEKYDMVVMSDAVVFAIPGHDLTDKVVTLMSDPSFK